MHFRYSGNSTDLREIQLSEYRVPASKHNQQYPEAEQSSGILFVVATPIGNLSDMSSRAIDTLNKVDCILAEDTRHSRPLLNHYRINTPLKACHEHNEAQLVDWVCNELRAGKHLALISDAGTPLISDPGFVLVRALREQGLEVQVIPGASSIIAALSIAGLPTDRFVFDGFLPAKSAARKQALEVYLTETRTIVLLESSHRIVASLSDVVAVLGSQRSVVVARELTKKFETVVSGSAQAVLDQISQDANQQRGEFVLMLAGVDKSENAGQQELRSTLQTLLAELPLKQAAKLASQLCNVNKNEAYDLALQIKNDTD